jgi:hypothetical protein
LEGNPAVPIAPLGEAGQTDRRREEWLGFALEKASVQIWKHEGEKSWVCIVSRELMKVCVGCRHMVGEGKESLRVDGPSEEPNQRILWGRLPVVFRRGGERFPWLS